MKRKSKSKPPIFVVMAVKWDWEKVNNSTLGSPIVRDRVWGFFYDLRTAKRSVRQDWGWNFSESGYYDGAIIEEVNEGYYNWDKDRRWFFRHATQKRTHKKNVVLVEMDEPKYYQNIVAITLG